MRRYRKPHNKQNRLPAFPRVALLFIGGVLVVAFILGQLLGAVEKTKASDIEYTPNAKQALKTEASSLVQSVSQIDNSLDRFIAGEIKEDQFYNSAEVYKYDLVILIDTVRAIKPESKKLQDARENLLNAMLMEVNNSNLLFYFIEDKKAAQLSDYKQNRLLTVQYLKKYTQLLK